MGASLLDAVLAETLDPAYARAAAARAAGGGRRSRVRGPVAVAVVMAVAGVLLAVTYQQAAASVQGREQVRVALVDDIHRSSDVTDELAGQLEQLRTEVTGARDELLDASAAGQRARSALAGAERDAAAVAVTGPGLLVTLANADPTADEDPVGGGTTEDLRGRVKDGDLQLVVNALWAAGAEAVSINGQRLGPTTAIRFAGEAVLVDFRPVTSPYEIRAVGDPDALAAEFLASPEVGALAAISQTFGLRFEYAEEDELALPAGSISELDSARPKGRDDAATTPEPRPGG